MDSTRWHRVRDLFVLAVERGPAERVAFLDDACGDDRGLREEVEGLLESYGEAGDFLEAPAVAVSDAHDQLRVGPGTRLGPYEIVELLGAGGMGEVYRARDDRLGREVAVKVLPPDVAWSARRLERFEQEARAASALNHPHILAVYDVGHHAGVHYLVTELLEGRTLDQKVAQAPPPLRRILEWGAQAARGLTEAHERGIVHCDLKPSNLFITTAGQLKILDFGLARLGPDAAAQAGPAPADTSPVSPFPLMGTMGYMSPEQARGEPMDFRSDQFSFGCVLYELITGTAPFQRASPAEILAAVQKDEPPAIAAEKPGLPLTVAWIVERCLAKDRDERYAATRDLARDLELSLSRLSELSLPIPAAARRSPRSRTGLAVTAALALAAGALAGWWAGQETPAVPIVRYLTYSGRDSSPAAAPDGRTVAFSSTRDGRRRIWLKQLGRGSEAPLTDGEDDHPRFSPDGSAVLFARGQGGRVSLYRVPSVGGEAQKLVDDAVYGDFSPDGRRIAFVRLLADAAGTASIVGTASVDGSDVRELARLDGRRFPRGAFVHPRWSPDGRYLAATQSTLQLGAPTVIALLDAESGRVRELSPPSDAGVWRGGLAWGGPDQVVCAQPESVVGQQTGTSSRVVLLDVSSGRARPLFWSPVNILSVDVLGAGRLVLGTRTLRQHLREVSLDPRRPPEERWLTLGNSADRQPTYSRDGEWIAFSSNRSGNLDLWAVSRRSGAVRRLTDDPAQDSDPGFMPDGRLLWSSNRGGTFEVWLAEADGSGARQVTQDGVDAENPVSTPDGQWIVYASANPRSRGIMKIRPDGREAVLIVSGNMIEPEVSPDGRHVAFVADGGTDQATLRVARIGDGQLEFQAVLPNWVPGGGIDQGRSRWRPDGRALAYIDQEKDGRYVVYEQPFVPGTDTSGSRRRLAMLAGDLSAESLGFSPDGSWLTVSYREQLFDLMLAEDVPAVTRARR